MVAYQIITGNSANPYWDMFSGIMLLAAVSGDSIILLFFDTRWKASLRDIMSKLT
jgi:hypothetical protein